MESLTPFLPWLAPLGVGLAAVLGMILTGRILNKQDIGSGHTQRRQFILLCMGVLSIILVIITLPISDTMRGQILSLIGILLSAMIALSSTTFVGNIMAGIMLTNLRSFRIGDFVQIGEHFGRVSERGLLHVEIQTEDRDLTTLPNLFLVTQPVKVVHAEGTIVSAVVSLGYDVPRQKIESALIEAAEHSELSDPFVQIVELGDFSVVYRVAGMLPEPKQLISARSRLRAKVLDHLHQANIEIVSPNFMNTRAVDPAKVFIPEVMQRPAKIITSDASPAPEKILFDKADDAESTERLTMRVLELDKEIRELEKQAKSSKGDGERESFQQQIAKLERSRERYQAMVAERTASEEQGPG